MSAGETARTNYDSARQEILERLQLRDNVLLIYLGAIGTIFGIALGTSVNAEILLIIPFLALGASVIVSQHNAQIGIIIYFIVYDLEPFFKKIGENAPLLDSSESIRKFSIQGIWMRSFGHFLVIIIPPIASLGINYQYSFIAQFPEIVLWWFGALSTLLSIYFILETHHRRNKIAEKLNSTLKPKV